MRFTNESSWAALLAAFSCCATLTTCGGTGTAPPQESGVTSQAGSGTAPPQGSGVTSQAESAIPQVLMSDGGHLARVRDSLRQGDPQYSHALSVLEEDADRALMIEPMSVVNKSVAPPSGDMHDYLSQAPYWWPDPSKSNGLPYIEKDGQRNPAVDRITDHENLSHLRSAVSALGLAFYYTGREAYAQQAARLVRVWFLDAATRMNPNLEFAQSIPGVVSGRSAGIIETRYLPDIIDGVTLLRGTPAWTATDDAALKAWMQEYLHWLVVSPHGRDEARRGNNQETWYDVQVAALAIYTGQTETARMRLQAGREAIGRQFLPDGRQPRELRRTRAWTYCIFNLTAYMHLAAIGASSGVDLWNYRTADGRSLRQGVDFLVPFATGEKHFPYPQITEFDPSALHPVLRWAALGWNDPKYREIAQQIGGDTARLDLTVP